MAAPPIQGDEAGAAIWRRLGGGAVPPLAAPGPVAGAKALLGAEFDLLPADCRAAVRAALARDGEPLPPAAMAHRPFALWVCRASGLIRGLTPAAAPALAPAAAPAPPSDAETDAGADAAAAPKNDGQGSRSDRAAKRAAAAAAAAVPPLGSDFITLKPIIYS